MDLLRCWAALSRVAKGQSLCAWEGEMEWQVQACSSSFWGWASAEENGSGECGVQEPRKH